VTGGKERTVLDLFQQIVDLFLIDKRTNLIQFFESNVKRVGYFLTYTAYFGRFIIEISLGYDCETIQSFHYNTSSSNHDRMIFYIAFWKPTDDPFHY